MKAELLEVLVAPGNRAPLELSEPASPNGDIAQGALASGADRAFPIRDGVPRMVASADGQEATQESFGAKWHSLREEERERLAGFQDRWFEQRFGFGDEQGVRDALSGARWVLDAGTGPGIRASRCARLTDANVVGMDISESVTRARQAFADLENLHFVQGDILEPPFRQGAFDFVIADQVLHHTPDCRRAFGNMAELVRPGGQLAVYVYRKKRLLRELADEHVRELTTKLAVSECMEFSEQVTELGRELARLDARITLEKGVPLLGIEPGEHDVQTLVYWTFLKCFWNEELGESLSTIVNFDWYHPPYASRHTEDEVLDWCREEGLEVLHLDVIESGISVRARRRD